MSAAVRRLVAVIFVLSLLLVPADRAAAQGNDQPMGKLDLTTLTPAAITFPTPALAEIDRGWVDHPGVTLSVQSRPAAEPWELWIRADAGSMGGFGKPVADILWRTQGSSVWTPLTVTDQPVIRGQGDADVTLHFRIRLDWIADVPDDYAAPVTFSATRP